MPLEILSHITGFLSASSVVRLRRCSKTLHRLVVLDGHFWRTQILNGGTSPYLYRLGDCGGEELDAKTAPGSLNWEDLARKLASVDDIMAAEEPALTCAPWGLRNRCRLWAIANQLITCSLE